MSEHAKTPLPVLDADEATTAGNYFVANYPPFSRWSPDHKQTMLDRFDQPGDADRTLGLYVHIPFCRKRCHFCYFRVYTDKNKDEIRDYLDAVIAEHAELAGKAIIAGRKPRFIYFGGGTPSYLSDKQLTYLFEGLQRALPWDAADEIAFECEPGTLNAKKVQRIADLGVTRLSLGIENFDDQVLELNNRAHRSRQVYDAYQWALDAKLPQINIDLIAGMLGETEDNWRKNIETTLELKPDAVTIYQMEIPYNTTIYKQMQAEGKLEAPVADWATKRRWVKEAFAELESAGYTVTSAYTAVRDGSAIKFLYRDDLWNGADMLAVGVSSFGHIASGSAGLTPDEPGGGGIHYQNQADIAPYVSAVQAGESPIFRALPITHDEALIRQWVLQLKLGRVSRLPFIERFGVDPFERWADILTQYQEKGYLTIAGDALTIDRDALLQIDRLLHAFFLPEHRALRYA